MTRRQPFNEVKASKLVDYAKMLLHVTSRERDAKNVTRGACQRRHGQIVSTRFSGFRPGTWVTNQTEHIGDTILEGVARCGHAVERDVTM